MLAFESRKRRRRWTKYPTVSFMVGDVELFAKFQTLVSNPTEIRTVDQKTREGHERRVGMVLPVSQFFVVKTFVVLRARMPQCVVIRMIRLNQNSPRPITTTCTPRNLGNQLKRSLRRSEIRQSQSCINGNNSHQSHIRKVVTLGQHLGP